MKLTNLTPITSKEYQNKFGDLLWNSVNNNNKLLINIEIKQCIIKNDNTKNKTFKDDFDKFTQQFFS